MSDIRLCEKCGVPEAIAGDQAWLNSGVIVQGTNLSWRMGFSESENLDPLFAEIEKIIGRSIQAKVMEFGKFGAIFYWENVMRPEISALVRGRLMSLEVMSEVVVAAGEINGFGKYQVREMRFQGDADDALVIRVDNPFSIPLSMGILAGCCEMVTGNPYTVKIDRVSGDTYDLSLGIGRAQKAARDIRVKPYYHRDGDIYLEPCASCGVPKALSNLKWDLAKGRITDSRNGKRMICLGSEVWDPLFKELEKEFGEEIPGAIIEAQRRLVRQGLFAFEDVCRADAMREEFAMRGWGNFREMQVNPNRAYFRVDHTINHPILIGSGQAFFEMAYGVESNAEWEVSDNGDLQVEIRPKKPLLAKE
jgi:hypothetical protein